jgi:hypothetical protein
MLAGPRVVISSDIVKASVVSAYLVHGSPCMTAKKR